MNRTQTHLRAAVILAGFMLLLLACNLGASENAPPTLAPLPTVTPQATLGYAAVQPVEFGEIGLVATPAPPPVDDFISDLLEQVESDRLMANIRSLQDFHTRHTESSQSSPSEGIGAARQYIKNQLQIFSSASAGNLYIFEVPFTAYLPPNKRGNPDGTQQYNIVGAIRGSVQNAGAIVIGAHYDSIGWPDDDPTVYAPGANDNGSGVAALLELARIMSADQYKTAVMFVFFAAEEFNRQGSIAFVSWLREANIDPRGMINLDTLGNVHDSSGRREERYLRVFSAGPNDSSPSRQLARATDLLSYNYALSMGLQVQDALDREGRYGDHISFSERDYPAIRFINAYEEKLNGDPTDTSQFIEPDYLRRATQAALAVTVSLADGPRPPAKIALRPREDGGQELVWEPVADAVSYIIALRQPAALTYQQLAYDETKLVWERLREFAGIAIAARDARGLIGPLSAEYVPS